jgi:hypothetical protein
MIPDANRRMIKALEVLTEHMAVVEGSEYAEEVKASEEWRAASALL